MGVIQSDQNALSGLKVDKIRIDIDVNKPIRPQLKQLMHWSLSDIRKVYDNYQSKSKYPFIDVGLFCQLMPFSKITNKYLFREFSLKQKYISIFEIMSALILLAFSSYKNKMHMYYVLFDFGCCEGISLLELMIIYKSVVMAYCRLSDQKMPDYHILQSCTRLTFLKADTTQTKEVSLKEMIQQVEGNEAVRALFMRFQPQKKYESVKESYTIFNHFKPYSELEINKMYDQLQKAYAHKKFHQARISNIQTQLRLGNKKYHTLYSRLSDLVKEEEQTSEPNNTIDKFFKINESVKVIPSSIRKLSSSIVRLPSLRKRITSLDTKIDLVKQQSTRNIRIPPLTSITSIKAQNFESKDSIMSTLRTKSKRLIFNGGQTISKEEIFELFEYFNSLGNHGKVIKTKQFFEAFENKPHMKRNISSMFKFLDETQKGEVQFEQLVQKIYPGLTADHMKIIDQWITLYRSKHDINYISRKKKSNDDVAKIRVLPATSMKRLWEIFNVLDRDRKGYLTFEDFRNNFKYGYTITEIEDYFKQIDTSGQKKIYIQQFAKLLLPYNFTIEGLETATATASYVSV